MDKIKRFWAICIDAKQQILVPYGSKLHIQPPNYHLLTVQQTQYYQNKLKVKYLRIFWRSHEQKDETERARGPGKKREETAKESQMMTLTYPTGANIGLPWPSGSYCRSMLAQWPKVGTRMCVYIYTYI